MKIWKLISGILSILLSAFLFYQSRFAPLADILSGGGNAGTAGVIAAITILAGGILSLFVKSGSVGGNLAITVLYGIAAICGFHFSGTFPAFGLYAIWCLICAFLALIDLAVNRRDADDDYEEIPVPAPAAPRKSASIPLKTVLLEKNPARRNAMIDVLPEKEAKSYLKKTMDALVNRESLQSDDDDDILKTILNVVFGLIGFMILGVALYFSITAIANSRNNADKADSSTLNFDGAWMQTNSKSKEAYQGIYISDDFIEIYRVNSEGI